jgi:hypothetical protein
MGLDTKTYLLTDRQSQCDFDFERMLHKDYDRKDSVEKKNFCCESHGTWRLDELFGAKPPVIK